MGSSGDSPHGASITGINVTPLVDVALVLLIVFLVTTQAIVTQSIPLDIPQRSGGEIQTILAVGIDGSNAISVDGRPVASAEELVRVASEARARNKDIRAVIRATSTTNHGVVVRALDALRSAQVTKIAFAKPKDE